MAVLEMQNADHRHCGAAPTALAIAFALVISGPVVASQGILEISQSCAVHTGCFSGDDPGFPVTIAAAGSYVLTSALDVDAPVSAIEITAEHVTLDLNSFVVSSHSFVSPPLINAAANAVAIRNGGVSGNGRGIELLDASSVEGVSVTSDGAYSIRVGAMGLVSGCIVRDTDAVISAGMGSLVLDNSHWPNAGPSITGSVFRGNRVFANEESMNAGDASLIVSNELSDAFMHLSADTAYRSNRVDVYPAFTNEIEGGIDAGRNLCVNHASGLGGWIVCP